MTPVFLSSFQRIVLLSYFNPLHLSLRGFHPLSRSFSKNFRFIKEDTNSHTTSPTDFARDSVCLISFSVALTNDISIDFFSSRY